MRKTGTICANCSKSAEKKCAKCKKVWYCTRKCQVQNWKKHKIVCEYNTFVDKVDENVVDIILNLLEKVLPNSKKDANECLDEVINVIRKQSERLSEYHKKLLFTIKNFRHMIPREEWIGIFSSSFYLDNFFFQQLYPSFEEKSMSFFRGHFVDKKTGRVDPIISKAVVAGKNLPNTHLRKHVKELVSRIMKRHDFINLKVVNCKGIEVYFKMKMSTPLRKLMDAYAKKTENVPGSLRFTFDGDRMNPDALPLELGMEDRDVIDAMVEQTGGKPVVLLYPPHDNFEVSKVKVTLNEEFWRILCSYPQIGEEKEEEEECYQVEWKNMKVDRNGLIRFDNKNDSRNVEEPNEVEYLFWESSTTQTQFDFNEIDPVLFIDSSYIHKFLFRELTQSMGLPQKEANNFICYWLGELKEKKACLVQFVRQEEYEKLVRLEVIPKADVTVKIFMLFVAVDGVEEIVEERMKRITVVERSVWGKEKKRRDCELGKEFVVFEWGGMNLKKSTWLHGLI